MPATTACSRSRAANRARAIPPGSGGSHRTDSPDRRMLLRSRTAPCGRSSATTRSCSPCGATGFADRRSRSSPAACRSDQWSAIDWSWWDRAAVISTGSAPTARDGAEPCGELGRMRRPRPAVSDGVVFVSGAPGGGMAAVPERCRSAGAACDPLWVGDIDGSPTSSVVTAKRRGLRRFERRESLRVPDGLRRSLLPICGRPRRFLDRGDRGLGRSSALRDRCRRDPACPHRRWRRTLSTWCAGTARNYRGGHRTPSPNPSPTDDRGRTLAAARRSHPRARHPRPRPDG